jgi:hypothetical protein
MKLKVGSARNEDVYKDIARINRHDRGGIRAGQICKVSVGQASRYFIVRGLPDRGQILLDDLSRDALNVKQGTEYDFSVTATNVFGRIRWACDVADPGPRIAAWLGVLSLVLAAIGIFLALFSIWS